MHTLKAHLHDTFVSSFDPIMSYDAALHVCFNATCPLQLTDPSHDHCLATRSVKLTSCRTWESARHSIVYFVETPDVFLCVKDVCGKELADVIMVMFTLPAMLVRQSFTGHVHNFDCEINRSVNSGEKWWVRHIYFWSKLANKCGRTGPNKVYYTAVATNCPANA